MARQMTFDLPARTAVGREDFFLSPANEQAVARLDAPEGWPNARLALVGPEGSGKSHLIEVWRAATGARVLAAEDLAEADVPGIDGPLALDSVFDRETPARATEETLFHLINHMALNRLPLLLASRRPPARWPVSLPDLKSRAAATDTVLIGAPDDALLAAIYVKLFTDRQLAVSAELIPWLVARCERSCAAAARAVAALDAAGLAEKRALTVPFARRVLDKLHGVAR